MAAFGGPELLVVELTIPLGELKVLDCASIWEARLEATSAGSWPREMVPRKVGV